MKYKSLLSVAVASALSFNAFADHSGAHAEDLVGKVYVGGHYNWFFADGDRLAVPNEQASSLDDGDGLGVDLGYRLSKSNEIRFQYTDLDIDAKNGFSSVDGSSIGLDFLHFPTQQSLYLLAGLKDIDLETEELSANVGMGYRHYFTEKLAGFVEARGYLQLDDHQKDFTVSTGLAYFFGTSKAPSKPKPAPRVKPATVKPETLPKPVFKDSDRDGVIDREDQCPNTPIADKVDARGCTIFTEEKSTMTLLIQFENNRSEITSNNYKVLSDTADFMNKYPHVNLAIEGHTSSVGKAAYNKTLSQKRADAVVEMLVNKYGIDADRLTAIGYGEERLLNDANTKAAHAENRRIQGKISVTEKVAVKK